MPIEKSTASPITDLKALYKDVARGENPAISRMRRVFSLPKDGNWKKFGDGDIEAKVKQFAKGENKDWQGLSTGIAAMVAKQIAEGRARKSDKKKKKKKKKKK
ncbi:MAG TPA: hypothetical protein VK101_07070 [Limnochordia bacterium]|nr:hypothetical protein [Limnochordia bacterium]